MGSQGRVEKEISDALPEIRESLNWITAKFSRGNEGSLLTSYNGDYKVVWRELRRELVLEGFASPHIKQHKAMIMDYTKELGERGLLDDLEEPEDSSAELSLKIPSNEKREGDFGNPENVAGNEHSPEQIREQHLDSWDGAGDADCSSAEFLDQLYSSDHERAVGQSTRQRQTNVQNPPNARRSRYELENDT